MTRKHPALAHFALGLLLLAGCDGEATGPGSGRVPATLELVSGDAQSDTVRSTLPHPLVVRVVDADGRPVAGAAVSWAPAADAGTVALTSTASDADGLTRASWTLGSKAGTASVTASGAGEPVRFSAVARPGSMSRLELARDTLTLGVNVERPLAIAAADSHGNAVTEGLTWSSSDPTVAGVAPSGVVTGLRSGSAVIRVAAPGLGDSVRVSVVDPPALNVYLVPGFYAIELSDTTLSAPLSSLAFRIAATTDGRVPLAEEFVLVDGAGRTDLQRQSSSYHEAIVTLQPGAHTVAVTLVDAAGNRVERSYRLVFDPSPAARYDVRYLGTLGGADSAPSDLNESGDVVGWARTSGGEVHAVLWRDGATVDLGAGPGGESRAVEIDGSGRVVGWLEDDCRRAFTWRDGARTIIEGCGLTPRYAGDDGTVLLERGVREYSVLADGEVRALAPPPGSGFYRPVVMNRLGWVTGTSFPTCVMGSCNLGNYVARPPWSAWTQVASGLNEVVDMNERGDLLGKRYSAYHFQNVVRRAGQSGAMPWDRLVEASPVAINNLGRVVGISADRLGVRHPFVWQDGEAFRLVPTAAAWSIDGVTEINDRGQVVGHGVNSATGQSGAVLLTPAP